MKTGKRFLKTGKRFLSCNSWPGGFSLIELVGVLALLTILAAVLFPVVIKRVDLAAWATENTSLNTLSISIIQSVGRQKQLPAPAGLPQAVVAESSLSLSQITNTLRRLPRVFLAEPGGICSTGYVQLSAGLPAPPANSRLLIISTLAGRLGIASGTPGATDFNNIWNAAQNTLPPASSLGGWTGKPEDLLVQRMNLQPLFHKLILRNADPWSAWYAIDSFTLTNLAPGNTATMYYLDGSALSLYYTNVTSLAIQGRQILRKDISFTFQYGRWSQGLGPGRPDTDPIAAFVDAYLGQTLNYTPKQFADLRSAVLQMYNFMYDYWLFTQIPCFAASSNPGPQVPEWQSLDGDQIILSQDTKNLIP